MLGTCIDALHREPGTEKYCAHLHAAKRGATIGSIVSMFCGTGAVYPVDHAECATATAKC
eukprot:3268530-Rhodomonas_salina.1